MEYISKYKAEEIEAILDAKNNTGERVDSNLDGLFVGQLQTKEVEVSEDTTIKADEGFLGLKEVSVNVSGGGGGSDSGDWEYFDVGSTVGSSENQSMIMYAAYFSGLAKVVEYRDEVITAKNIGPIAYAPARADYDYYSQFAINMATTCADRDGVYTLREVIEKKPNSEVAQMYSALSSFPRLTESEFYAL